MANLSTATVMPYLYVMDWEGARLFYTDVLGLAWRQVTPDWAIVTAAGSSMALISEYRRHETGPVHRAGVFFAVPDGLAELAADLERQGVEFAWPLRRVSHGAELAIRDPDGNMLVLYQTAIKPQT